MQKRTTLIIHGLDQPLLIVAKFYRSASVLGFSWAVLLTGQASSCYPDQLPLSWTHCFWGTDRLSADGHKCLRTQGAILGLPLKLFGSVTRTAVLSATHPCSVSGERAPRPFLVGGTCTSHCQRTRGRKKIYLFLSSTTWN